MAGDVEDSLADAVADAWVRTVRYPGGLAKSERKAEHAVVRKAARNAVAEQVTPVLVQMASLGERIEFLEAQQRKRAAEYGGGRG